jgi:hypothetical protein
VPGRWGNNMIVKVMLRHAKAIQYIYSR